MNLLYSVVALELFIGGGGRLTEIGPVTLRMLLFAVVLATVAASIWVKPHRRGPFTAAMLWILAYLTIHIIALLRGTMNGASTADAFADLQPTLYWLAAPFFALAMESRKNISRTGSYVIFSAMVLSIAYFAIIAIVMLGYIDPFELWKIFLPSGEFFYRNPLLFFYKGDLYLGIAIVFLVSGWRPHPVFLAIIVTALILTLTRGFVISAVLAATLMFIKQQRGKAIISMAGMAVVLAYVLQLVMGIGDDTILGDRASSDNQRLDDLLYMVRYAGLDTVLLGEGFGTLINSRMNIEISYMWMLWKGGLPMLIFWLLPLCLSYRSFRLIPRKSGDFQLACAFFYSTVFIYIQTATNPFLNNPIGLSFVIISMFALSTLARPYRSRLHRAVEQPRTGAFQPAASRPTT